MKNCVGARTHETMWVTKLMAVRSVPASQEGVLDSLHRTGYTAGVWGFKKPPDTLFSETYKVCPVCELSLKCSHTAPPNAGPMSGA